MPGRSARMARRRARPGRSPGTRSRCVATESPFANASTARLRPGGSAYNGVYSTLRDRVRIDSLNARWSFDGTALRLSDMTGGSCGDTVIWTTNPWVLRSDPAQGRVGGSGRHVRDGAVPRRPPPLRRPAGGRIPQPGARRPGGPPGPGTLSFTLDGGAVTEYESEGSRVAIGPHGMGGQLPRVRQHIRADRSHEHRRTIRPAPSAGTS